MIRLDALRAFVEVAKHGNIKDAADKLGRTPSALSMTLKLIEHRIGSPLFESDRKSTLTWMGKFLLETSLVLIRDYDRAMELVVARAQAHSGFLRLASVPSVAAVLMPPILQEFFKHHPDVEMEFVDTDSTDVCRLVEIGQVEIGIAGSGCKGPMLSFEPIFRDAFHLVCQADSPLGEGGPETLEWSQLGSDRLILNEAVRSIYSEGFLALAAQARMSIRNVTSLIAMVQAGMGVTLLPALATLNLPPNLRTRRLADPACTRTVGLYRREGKVLSPVASAFRALFTESVRARANTYGLDPTELIPDQSAL